MNVVIGAKTDPGRRANNEDYFAVVDVRRHRLWADGLLIIADGMGGRHRGEHAATTAVETVQDALIEMLAMKQAAQADTAEALASALRKANACVYELSRQDLAGQGMGTTCVTAVIQENTLTLAHAGDSRAYLLRDGFLKQLTDDHSYVAEQVRTGAITQEGARSSRFRNVITRAIGIEPTITPDVSRHEVRPGDVLMLCTDGLSNIIVDADIAQTLEYAPTPQAAADRLVQQANRAGGKDNITAIVARLEVGSQTTQMRPEDLPRLSGTLPASEEDTLPKGMAVNGREEAKQASSLPPVVSAWPLVAAVVFLLMAAIIGGMTHVLLRDGYRFRTSSPFVARPAPPPVAPINPVNLSKIIYEPPIAFYVKPVQGGFLSLSPTDGSLTVVTLDGRVVRLSGHGALLFESPPLSKKAAAMQFAFPSDSDLHAALDAAGNFYVADSSDHLILKYGPDLVHPLGRIPGLKNPGAISVAPDGTIYVIDNERLKVIRPAPAGASAGFFTPTP